MSRMQVNRRKLLRGLGRGVATAVALPCLEAMLNNRGDAYADGAAFPKRFGIWFWGCGSIPAWWTPEGAGASWAPPPDGTLTPIAEDPMVKSNVSVLSGFEAKGSDSHYTVSTILSGDMQRSTFKSPSLDVVVADAWKGKTKFPSLVLASSRHHGAEPIYHNISWNGPGNPNPPEVSPLKLFNRLFRSDPGAGDADKAAALLRGKRSVLDFVLSDSASFRASLGATDRARVDQHLDNIRTIEKQLTPAGAAACGRTLKSPADAPEMGAREDLQPTHDALTDLLVMALQCDLTRVFSFSFTSSQSSTIFWQVGANTDYHGGITHRPEEGDNKLVMKKAMRFTMERYAEFVKRLHLAREGDQSLLDSCCVLATSELSDPSLHLVDEFPILLAGKSGGRLRTGIHYRSTNKESTTKVLLTTLRAVGLERASFGVGDAHTTEVVPAVIT